MEGYYDRHSYAGGPISSTLSEHQALSYVKQNERRGPSPPDNVSTNAIAGSGKPAYHMLDPSEVGRRLGDKHSSLYKYGR